MSKQTLRVPSQEHQPDTSRAQQPDLPIGEPPHADAEMTRVLKTAPLRMAADSSNGAITFWRHDPLHDVVRPMADHVIMTFPAEPVRFERRDGKARVNGMTRPGTLTVIPAGSTSRWDIYQPLSVLQLYLPQATLTRVAREAGTTTAGDLVERTAHPDPITSRLLLSAADALEGCAALDTLFRHQLTDLLATRLLAAHAGLPATVQPVMGGLSPKVLGRAIERLRSDSDADLSLAALAADAGLSRFHFCRAFKESTGLSPHAWLRQHRLEQAMNMLRDTNTSVVTVAAALGYSSQTAFAAAFRKLTGETPSDWRRRMR
ncbi:helix-turn-helix transcriptional regulator [Bradyrhizobium sp. AUGA SZCCT0431]|uniref:helix-turn-helix transcriptional regulator n=1 Tax=Bradyrhizobium sp. AUGA SZCCT0431 TaxID=2807674 RepID=UPI001BABB94E|nr:helix-turn-helix transcriptional regulator [Bradyrhizobium sp. AUGA SZCCT0431]MBR1146960.1 helix-turn-helix transcriptional regulator [Bradyrhizobium sp. AUGA SZCCT0431]